MAEADALAKRLGTTRSALVQLALHEFVRRAEERRIVERINASLQDVCPDEDRDFLDAALPTRQELSAGW